MRLFKKTALASLVAISLFGLTACGDSDAPKVNTEAVAKVAQEVQADFKGFVSERLNKYLSNLQTAYGDKIDLKFTVDNVASQADGSVSADVTASVDGQFIQVSYLFKPEATEVNGVKTVATYTTTLKSADSSSSTNEFIAVFKNLKISDVGAISVDGEFYNVSKSEAYTFESENYYDPNVTVAASTFENHTSDDLSKYSAKLSIPSIELTDKEGDQTKAVIKNINYEMNDRILSPELVAISGNEKFTIESMNLTINNSWEKVNFNLNNLLYQASYQPNVETKTANADVKFALDFDLKNVSDYDSIDIKADVSLDAKLEDISFAFFDMSSDFDYFSASERKKQELAIEMLKNGSGMSLTNIKVTLNGDTAKGDLSFKFPKLDIKNMNNMTPEVAMDMMNGFKANINVSIPTSFGAFMEMDPAQVEMMVKMAEAQLDSMGLGGIVKLDGKMIKINAEVKEGYIYSNGTKLKNVLSLMGAF